MSNEPNSLLQEWVDKENKVVALGIALGCEVGVAEDMAERCLAAVGIYLRKTADAAVDADYARSRKLLAKLAAQSDEFVASLYELQTDIRTELIMARGHVPDVSRRDSMFYLDLVTELKDFATTARWISSQLRPRPVGHPEGAFLQQAVGRMIDTVERFARLPVGIQRTRGSVVDPHFVGSAGLFLRDAFHAVDSTVAERQLANAVRAIRGSWRTPNLLNYSVKRQK